MLHSSQDSLKKYKEQLENSIETGNKRLKMDRIEAAKPRKNIKDDTDKFDPFQHEGPESNVFKIEIDFL